MMSMDGTIIKNMMDVSLSKKPYYDSLYITMQQELNMIFIRTFIFELKYRYSDLHGNSDEEKYKYFCGELDNEETQNELRRTYPVLFKALEEKIKTFIDYLKEIEDHFRKDKPKINQCFFNGNPCSNIIDIDFSKGDSHHNGKKVAILTFDNHRKLVYKPHSVQIDYKFQILYHWFTDKIGIGYYWNHQLECGTYGWCEYIEKTDCKSVEEVSRYYYRNGILLFMARLLGSLDLHYENLIAHGEYPIIIDLETALSGGETISEIKTEGLNDIIQHSILQSGLLPLYVWGKDGKGVNISSLNGTAGQIMPLKVPVVVNAGSTDMRIEYKDAFTKPGQNLCMLNGVFCDPYTYNDAIIHGFRDSYTIARNNMTELERLIIQFAGVPVRKLLRDTQSYSMILSLSWHPKFLIQEGQREQLLLKLDKKLPEPGSFNAWKLQEEKESLLRGDIPYFWFDPAETELISDHGERYTGYFHIPVLDTICNRLHALSDRDLKIQERLIHGSLGMSDATSQKNLKHPYVEDTFFYRHSASNRIGKEIIDNCVIAENGEVGWIQSIYAGYQEQGILTRATDPYLYNGFSGILLFLMKLIRTEPQTEYQQLAQKLTNQLTEIINKDYRDYPVTIRYYQTGIYTGEASLAFICQLLFLQTGKKKWLGLMKRQLQKMIPLIDKDKDYDLLAGNAGAIMAYLNAYKLTGETHYLQTAVHAGDYLICKADKLSYGWCWPANASKKGLTGMAHGNSGIMLAFTRLGFISHQERFYNAACQAMCYEDFFYSRKKRDWMDLRFIEQPDLIKELLKKKHSQDINDITRESPGWMNVDNPAWCHGKAGIALSRYCAYKYTNDSLRDKLMGIEYDIKGNRSIENMFCLCHGVTGLAVIIQCLDRQINFDITEMLSALCDDSINLEDALCLQERMNYGLMSGIAGIGYMLLSSNTEMQTLLTGDIS